MNNLKKVGLTALGTALVSTSAISADVAVGGGAALTLTGGDKDTQGNGWTMTDSVTFAASGEMDNGYTWKYSMELDPSSSGTTADTTGSAPGQAINDDTQISLTMNDMGTIKVCVSECGNNKKWNTSKLRNNTQRNSFRG